MLNRIIKYVLIALLLAASVYLFFLGHIGWGIFVFLLIGFVVISLFRHELILLSFYYLRKNNFAKADATLDRIKEPEALPKRQEAYYYFLKALTISQQNQITKSEKYFRKALSIGLRMKHDEAVAKLNLAGISVMKRRKRDAINLLSEVKKLDTRKMLDEQVKMIQEQIKRI